MSSDPDINAKIGYIDVVGEANSHFGLVKISLHTEADNPRDCPEWQAGDYEGLEVLHFRSVPVGDIHWHAWLIFRHLREHHVVDDWFDVRHLVEGADWPKFLTNAIDGTLPDSPRSRRFEHRLDDQDITEPAMDAPLQPASLVSVLRQWMRDRSAAKKALAAKATADHAPLSTTSAPAAPASSTRLRAEATSRSNAA